MAYQQAALSSSYSFAWPAATGLRASISGQSRSDRSSSLDNYEGDTMRQSFGTNPRNIRCSSRRIFRERISTRDVTVALADALVNVPTKDIADASGSSLRAAENAKSGINAMCLAHFFNACQQIPELKAMALDMMGCEPVNPDRERALAMLVNSYVQQQGRGE